MRKCGAPRRNEKMKNKTTSDKPKLNVSGNAKQEVAIVITNHYRHLVEFSIVSVGGLYEVLQMYVELLRMRRCVSGPLSTEAVAFRTNYSLILVPDVRSYPILAPTITNSRDGWILKGEDVDLFGIHFVWPQLMSAEVAIKVELFDHIRKEKKLISSDLILLERNGEKPTEIDFIPEDNIISISPYLYKLLTVAGLVDKVKGEEQLNRMAFNEIVSMFHSDPQGFSRLLDEHDDARDLIFGADAHPSIALRLLDVANTLRNYLNVSQSTIIKILFLASNPTDTPPLRLDEEIRSIDQALRQSKFRDRFDLQQCWAVRVTDIQGHLLRCNPHIVHFSGHGGAFNGIVLEDDSGKSRPVTTHALSKLFSILKDNIRCVVLNACYSKKQARAISKHIDCVIGMSNSIGDSAAISFAAAFYQALGYGRDIKTAFDLGCTQIDLSNLSEQDAPKLFVRKGGTMQLFPSRASPN